MILLGLLVLAVSVVLAQSPGQAFDGAFQGYDACLVVQKVGESQATVFGRDRSARRFSPCSTFKIPHTVAALHFGVVMENEVFKWDGRPRNLDSWEADFDLKGALKASVFPIYQTISTRLGIHRETALLRDLNYGNQDVSGGLDQFWLTSSLAVSAVEQVRVVRGLVRETWPFDNRAMRWTKANLMVDSGDRWKSFGKTGSGVLRDGWQIGWWVGWVEREGSTWVFAGNYEGADAMGHRMRPKVETVLKSMGILP